MPHALQPSRGRRISKFKAKPYLQSEFQDNQGNIMSPEETRRGGSIGKKKKRGAGTGVERRRRRARERRVLK